MKKFLFLLMFIIASMWQCAKAGDSDTAWTREVIGNNIRDVKFSPDGSRIVTVHDNALIYFWETSTGNIIKIMNKHLSGARAIAYSTDGNYLYSGGEGGKIYKFNCQTYDSVQDYLSNYPKLQSWVVSLCISNDNSKIFAGTGVKDSNNILVIDEKTGTVIKSLGMQGSVAKLILSNDNNYVAAFSEYFNSNDNSNHWQLSVWNAINYQLIKIIDDTKETINDIGFTNDSKLIALEGKNIFKICF